MAIRVAGTTEYNRKDNRGATPACISFEGKAYQILHAFPKLAFSINIMQAIEA